jgi:molybdopterin-guanine dinucleotide biosynthesis protein A
VAEQKILAAILAGGAGSRLGGEKPSAELLGRPLISYPIEAAQDARLETVVVAKPSTELPVLDVPVVLEPEEPRHPLCGVLAALERGEGATAGAVLAIGCDMPFLSAGLLAWLAGLDGAALLEASSRLQPLPGRYPAVSKERIAEALRENEAMSLTLTALRARRVGTRDLERFGEPRRLLFNVNEPTDLLYAARMLAAGS